MRPPLDLRGERYGRLVAVQRQPDGRWLCQCDCGTQTVVRLNNLRSGRTQSCGCLHRDMMSGNTESVPKPQKPRTAPDKSAKAAFAEWNKRTAKEQESVFYALKVLGKKHAALKDSFDAALDVLRACTMRRKK